VLPDSLFDNLDDDWTQLGIELGDALLASYLLGLAHVRAETGRLELAEGDPPPKMTAGPIKLRFNVPPAEAVEYFKAKKLVTKKEFNGLRHDAQAAAFTVSGIYRKDVLQAFQDELAAALANGTPQAKVIKRFRDILAGAGHRKLGAWHLEAIFRTNMGIAYGVGRRRALEEVADDLPYWEYHAVKDDRTRPAHAACDGIILPADHEFWQTHYPPWAFACRCSVTARASVPEGYNHENPTGGDYKLAYDPNGLPVKASDGIQVHDLSAGKFVGVPAQGRLREAVERAAQRALEQRSAKTPKAALELEDKIRFNPRETVAIFDRDGQRFWQREGEPDQVEFDLTRLEEALAKGGTLTHNHPTFPGVPETDPRWKGGTFSAEDVATASALELAELRAVSFGYRHSMRPPAGGWNKELGEKIVAAFRQTYDRVLVELILQVREGKLSLAVANLEAHYLAWQRVAKEFGLNYKRSEK
jgi:SPP1 gp7 family putative phage head morphogenesis protein